MQTAFVIFSKVPWPGKTKSRLHGKLSAEECALFHRACLIDLHEILKGTGCKAILYFTGGSREEFALEFPGQMPHGFEELKLLQLGYFTFRQQHGEDLGERLHHAVTEVLRCYERVILLGSDLPGLAGDLLLSAAENLAQHDVVIGPAVDGGYYLLGLKKAYKVLFQGISWGSGRVLEQTLKAAENNNLKVSFLPVKRDIDTWEDLVAYVQSGRKEHNLKNMLSFRLAEYLLEIYDRQ
ncbi:TIGR04282 family arsenosugar biosynthesis glycosyltransferase [Desulfoscipio geothermicus]|uniref:Glycosyltransferase n=1 Tax=Desulfoscipio geothermicus DSM 3669 TaxID=1121426 RepID=A0A1I6EFC4_9FIRM|nr:TIGR04282 family arsenosugar biosynthesis glycosyltransferase [Desulfoscipio geothermicus]SFR16433.1 hypothetical protein SAMN05660706_14011 [Desulfoscipio geothermicus DSM 3669]